MIYDVEADAFYRKQPFDSWTLDTSTYTWQPPVTKPSGNYRWNVQIIKLHYKIVQIPLWLG